ncbi:Maf-like protein [Clostridium sp. JN-1]|uniref:Maf-like protein n=1 Tax=Clostridium sp. JN-1 TaxID=2483110 RepID=UPI000F0B8B74|nr:Maf-like protein [Clostridium sp. JN-1]
MRVILASASSRRQELFHRLTDNFEIIVSNFDESLVEFKGNCAYYVMELAEQKAVSVKNSLNDKVKNRIIIVGCDTIVSFKNKILGKPKDEKEAFNMLKLLSGNVHKVYSGIALVDTLKHEVKRDFVCTDVKFSTLSDNDIIKYIKTGEGIDKAGAYGIQGYGGIFVEEIHGCYYNVVGLPLNKLSNMLRSMGVNL